MHNAFLEIRWRQLLTHCQHFRLLNCKSHYQFKFNSTCILENFKSRFQLVALMIVISLPERCCYQTGTDQNRHLLWKIKCCSILHICNFAHRSFWFASVFHLEISSLLLCVRVFMNNSYLLTDALIVYYIVKVKMEWRFQPSCMNLLISHFRHNASVQINLRPPGNEEMTSVAMNHFDGCWSTLFWLSEIMFPHG